MSTPVEALKGKTAGVPNGVLALVVLAGLGFAWYRKKQNATADGATDTSTGSVASDGSTSLQGAAPAMFAPIPAPVAGGSGADTTGFQSNVEWTGAALKWAVANPNVTNPPINAVTAGTALGSYLAGAGLTQKEYDIINAIIGGIGPPPFPPQGNVLITPVPSPVAPAPTPTPAPAPAPTPAPAPAPAPSHTYYTVVKYDNLTSIGRKFGLSWQTIYNNNRNLIGGNPNLIHPGQRLFIR